MTVRRHPSIQVLLIAFFYIFVGYIVGAASPVVAKETPAGAGQSESFQDAALMERLKNEDIESIMASMSDEQVRRLLLLELQKQAEQQAVDDAQQQKPEGLAGFIQRTKDKIDLIKGRIAILQSGGKAAPEQIPDIFTYLGQGEPDANAGRAIWSVVIVMVAGLAGQWLFFWYTASVRRRIEQSAYAVWYQKLTGLFFRALLDVLTLAVFAILILAVFYLFFDRTTPQRVLVATYMVAILIVEGVVLILRIVLAPKRANLRLLPISDATARYLFNWITAIAILGSFGMLTCGIIRLAGASEAEHFKMVSLVGIAMALMLMVMIIQKRKPVAAALAEGLPPESLRHRMAQKWHRFAILGVVVLWIAGTIYGLIGTGRYPGLKTLIIFGLFFLFDWILRQMLDAAFGLAQQPDDIKAALSVDNNDSADEDAALVTETTDTPAEEEPAETPVPVNISRMKRVIRIGLRITLAALVFFWILNVWGITLPIGEAVARAAFNILIVVLICYVAWEVVSAAIQRRMKEVAPDDDMEEMEEGGAGGSRIGTLLVLLRKTMLVVIVVMAALIILSAIGVDIGPLIAGAGVIGLAIGFGAQTLVKDIIAGVFFLIDDAFRVGDYIQASGSKGLVEHISLRSLRLRHPRGMVNTIPFGSMGTVTNYSRDYIITKLNFRVRYDTDTELVRKLIKKKVYKPIMKNEELAPKLLGKIKSQGVREMDDAAMVMRIKYKTRPGDQFIIRKEVYRLMQEAFQDAGIELNPQRNVTVYLPPEITQAAADAEQKLDPNVIKAGAAAALTTQLEEEEKARAQAAESKKK